MKTKLMLALTLSVLAANTFAADGYDRTGSAAFTTDNSAVVSSAGDDRSGAAKVATNGADRTDTARTN